MDNTAAAFRMISAVCEAIRESKRIPSGTLYAMLLDRMDLEAYNKMIGLIKRTGLVTEVNHELIWIGPLAGLANPSTAPETGTALRGKI